MLFADYLPAVLSAASSFAQGWQSPRSQPKQVDYYARNLKTISEIYNLTVWPSTISPSYFISHPAVLPQPNQRTDNLPIITQGGAAVPPGLFAENATGRVSPLGNFTGFEDSIEYFFALALVPSPPAYSVFSKATVVEFSSGCPEVAASVAWLETRVDNANLTTNGQYLSTLKQVGTCLLSS